MTDKRKDEMPDDVRIMLEIASDKDVADCFHGTNFGSIKPREIIADTLLKTAGGYSTGYTALTICCELKLLTKRQKSYWLTKKGKEYLFWSHQRPRADISPPVPDDVTVPREVLQGVRATLDWYARPYVVPVTTAMLQEAPLSAIKALATLDAVLEGK